MEEGNIMNTTYNDIDGTEAGHPPTKPRRWPWIAGIVAALFIGAAIGSAGGDTTPTAEPEVVTETETVVETVTETVEVEVAPDACFDAFELASEGFGYAGEFAGYTSELATISAEAIVAAAYGDAYTLEVLTGDVEAVNSGINGLTAELERIAPDYIVARDACLAAGR